MSKFLFIASLLIVFTNGQRKAPNNVCKHYADYTTKLVNRNCFYNPDVDSRTPYIIQRHGYPLEIHQVVTEDGYILQMFRIPHNKGDNTTEKTRQPIFIQHGANTDSAVWVDIGNRSLAFTLVEMGYDVWLGNIRGSTYSQGHVYYNKDQEEFWDFSFHEMGIHDVPAQLDRISETTGMRGKIIYIGHSMGTTMSYIYSIRRKQHAGDTLIGAISLAPVAYLHNTKYLKYFADLNQVQLTLLLDGLRKLGYPAITPNQEEAQKAYRLLCERTPIQIEFCQIWVMLVFGIVSPQMQPQDWPLYLSYLSSGMSTKALEHFVQLVNGPFKEFDYGPLQNRKVYGRLTPPEYDLSSISIPFHLFYGKNDAVAGEADVTHLYNNIGSSQKSLTSVAPNSTIKFNHIDFMYAKDIKTLLYPFLFEKISVNFKAN